VPLDGRKPDGGASQLGEAPPSSFLRWRLLLFVRLEEFVPVHGHYRLLIAEEIVLVQRNVAFSLVEEFLLLGFDRNYGCVICVVIGGIRLEGIPGRLDWN
jgi:hypothetical protein